MLFLPSGFQHRRTHSPAPLPMWIPQRKLTAPTLDLASPLPNPSLPLTPPLTPASTRRPDSIVPSYPFLQFDQTLPSPSSPTHPRPLPPDSLPSRFLLVTGVPRDAPSHTLKQAFLPCGDLKGIFVRFQADHGAIVLAFYDIRHTLRAHRQISATSRPFFDNTRLHARFISADELRGLIGQSNFVTANDGALRIATSAVGPTRDLDPPALQNVLASFGELRVFRVVDSHAKAYHVEFFDARDATSALHALDGRVILNERLHLAPASPAPSTCTSPSPPPSPPPTSSYTNSHSSIPFPTAPSAPASPPLTRRRLSVDSSVPPSRTPPTPGHPYTHERRTSNIYHFDSVGKMPVLCTPPRPRSISVASDVGLGVSVPLPADADTIPDTNVDVPAPENVQVYTPPSPAYAPTPHTFPLPLLTPTAASLPLPLLTPTAASLPLPLPPTAAGPVPTLAPAPAPERNRIDIERIARGDDTRTTVMIKNIPNKMSDRHLLDFIAAVAPRRIDFLYLRMDFTNGCNVGYAFVNFIHVEDLLHFAKTKLGTKWNLFSSEKILGMSYANYQGKEALIDKFRSSSIMEQRESWRPKLFYSSGPKKGLPEEFPAPVHTRRRERGGGSGPGSVSGSGAGANDAPTTGRLFHRV